MSFLKRISQLRVKCRFCGFTTGDSKQESAHVITHSINDFICSPITKKIIKLINEEFEMNCDEAVDVFSKVCIIMNEKESQTGWAKKFTLLDCFSITKGKECDA